MNPKNFFAELKRRNVYKVAIAYAVVAWLLMQVASQIFPFFEIPNWAVRLVVLLLLIGFPVALVLAWAFELTPEGIKRTAVADEEPVKRSKNRAWIYIVIIVGATSVGLFFLGRYTAPAKQSGSANVPGKSIAVLPFANLSEEKENAFFADGIQDELLASLSKIRDLKVISRTSVAGFRDTAGRNLRDIGRSLGVANILEGSVRRGADRVRVTVQLIDARDDRHVWAETYDRKIADSLTLEGELATEIADALRATLTPEEKARVQSKPTSNPDAYIFYLRGVQYQANPDNLLQRAQLARQCLTEAIKLDPSFALAHARLSATISSIYFNFEPTEENRRQARAEADEALRLRPDLGEGHVALGVWLYWIEGDYEAALQEFGKAARLLPNNSDVAMRTAAVLRRQGHWRDALAGFLRAQELDPRNAGVGNDVAFTYLVLRDWERTIEASDRVLAFAPDSLNATVFKAYAQMGRTGDVAAAQKVIASIPADVDPEGIVTIARWDLAMTARDFIAAEHILQDCRHATFVLTSEPEFPKEYFEGCTALAKGDGAAVSIKFEAALPRLEAAAAASPNDALRHGLLGSVYAFLGRKEEAIREANRGVELKPENKDAVLGPRLALMSALIYAHTGETAKAVQLIQRLLLTPSAVSETGPAVTQTALRLHWAWDPLRRDPEFQKLLTGPEPKTVYK